MAVTHLVVTLLLIRLFRLDRNEAFACLLLGVFIDFDHLFGMIDFIHQDGINNILNMHAAMHTGIQWKSLMHDPMAAIILVPAAVGFRFFMPLVAWALHLLMDYVQMHYLGIASIPEFIFLGLLIVCYLYLGSKDLHFSDKPVTLRNLLNHEAAQLDSALREVPVLGRLMKKKEVPGTFG